MLKEEDIALIDAFINGELGGNELNAFIERRKSDPEFDKEVELLLSISEGYERIELKEQMRELEEQFRFNETEVAASSSRRYSIEHERFNYRKLAIAAGIAALISTPFIIQHFNESPGIDDGKRKYGTPQDTILPNDSIKGIDGDVLPIHLQLFSPFPKDQKVIPFLI